MNELKKALLVDDDESIVISVRELLRWKFDVDYCRTLADTIAYLEIKKCDVILLDLGLADERGLETFRRLIPFSGETPIVILTGAEDETLAHEAIAMGAQDYVFKGDLEVAHLERSLNYAIDRQKFAVKAKDVSKNASKCIDRVTTFMKTDQ